MQDTTGCPIYSETRKMPQKVLSYFLQEQFGNPASLPDGLLVTLGGPRRLLLLAGQHGPVDGDVLQGLALGARVGDLGLGDHAAPLGPDGARVVAAVGRGTILVGVDFAVDTLKVWAVHLKNITL